MTTEEKQYPVGAERAILVFTAISAALLQLIDTSIVNVSLREISGSIGATTSEIAWTVTSYAISNVIMIPLSGMLGDLFGRKRYFTISILIFTVASLFCGLSNSLWMLVFWRFVQGIGGGALLTTAQSIIVEAFPPEKLNIANAIFGMGLIMGPTFGPTLGGYLTDNYSWHWIFYINVPIGLLAAYLSWTFVSNREGARRPERIDWAGIGLLILAIGTLQFVLEEGRSLDWFESREIVILTILAVAGMAGFIWREWTFDHPAVKLRLLTNWNLALGTILSFVVGVILFATVFVFPLFVQIGLGWSATKTGNFMIPGALATAVTMGFTGRLLSKGTNPKAIMVIGTIMVFLFAAMMSFSSPDSSESEFFWPFILRGIGMAFMMSPVMALSLQGISPMDIPQAAGINNMIRQLGGAIGVALMTVVLESRNAVNYDYLLQQMSEYSEITQNRLNMIAMNFQSQGYFSEDARQIAYRLMERSLFRQESLVSYNNIFWAVAISVLFCLPIIFLIRRDKKVPAVKAEVHIE